MKQSIDDVKGEGLFYNYLCIHLPKNFSYSQMTAECWELLRDSTKDISTKLFCDMMITLSNNEEMQEVFGEPTLVYRFNIIKGRSSIVSFSGLAKYFNMKRSSFYKALESLESSNMIKVMDRMIIVNPKFRTWSELCAKEVADMFGIKGEIAENSHWRNFEKERLKKKQENYKVKVIKEKKENIITTKGF